MKNIFTSTLFLFIFIGSYAQFQIDSVNWQQYIPALLGGDCVTITNVTYSGSPSAGAKFTYSGSQFGINSGILITSGKANDTKIDTANVTDYISTYSNSPGDADLSTICGWQTYDAAVIEFDFTAPATTNVFLTYVFASEEYSQFVNTSFNDVFAFFVSGPGISGNQNIALVPGTSDPVSINTINNGNVDGTTGPCVNCQYFVNNQIATDPLYNEFGFNAYTTPLNANFTAQGGQTYHIKIAISDAGDGVLDSGIFLSLIDDYQDLNGQITFNGNPATAGIAEVFGYNTDSTACPLIAAVPLDATGAFTADSLLDGSYLVRITLDPLVYPGTYPVYYAASELWTGADIVTLPCFGSNITLNPQGLPVGGGTGTIGGTMWTDTSFQKAIIVPLENVSMFLYDSLSNQLISYSKTGSDGKFIFPNIAAGTYKIIPDIPGLYIKSVRYVNIAAGEQIMNLDYLAQYNGISVQQSNPVSIDIVASNDINISPNPASQFITIKVTESVQNLNFQILDMNGKVVLSREMNLSSNELYSIDIQHLSNGFYTYKIIGDKVQKVGKWIKH